MLPSEEFSGYSSRLRATLAGVRTLVGGSVTSRTAFGHMPTPEENDLQAWAWKGKLSMTRSGPLHGMRIAIKDNIAVAGMPMRNGWNALAEHVPEHDAAIVSRALRQAATIEGKATCEALCLSTGSHTSQPAPVLNPLDRTRSAGGSSSGCAALVASGEVDAAIGTDQGGSIRVPASFCGLVGLKPTHGRLPYEGAIGLEASLDNIGILSRDVANCAQMFDALLNGLGQGGMSPAQDLNGVSIGVLSEGFGTRNSESEVDNAVEHLVGELKTAGASCAMVSVPEHKFGTSIWTVIAMHGLRSFFRRNVFSRGDEADVPAELLDQFVRMDNVVLPPMARLYLEVPGKSEADGWSQGSLGLARQAQAVLRDAYDAALRRFNVLILPTTPMRARKLPQSSDPVETYFREAFVAGYNTAGFNVSQHPVIALPCGPSSELPSSVSIVGAPCDERMLFRVASAIEATQTIRAKKEGSR